jgi:hypothetical protein
MSTPYLPDNKLEGKGAGKSLLTSPPTDQANILNVESLLFSLKQKGITKQMSVNDFLKRNANSISRWK